ncbi:hypothetical protein TNCV_1404801 [Trichonephila clavipes]|nr:hypothetical protein TNCV_1404801 [Trichonephila clavipes]
MSSEEEKKIPSEGMERFLSLNSEHDDHVGQVPEIRCLRIHVLGAENPVFCSLNSSLRRQIIYQVSLA